MHPDHRPYFKLTGLSRFDKAVNTLLGIVEGISMDGKINSDEVLLLRHWIDENSSHKDQHPFTELLPIVSSSISDGVLDAEEHQDLVWLCERLRSTKYYEPITADIQRLHGIMAGIAADWMVSESELHSLSEWLEDHSHLKTCWPYDEVDSLITAVLSDGKINPKEQELLIKFFNEFIAISNNRTIDCPITEESGSIGGLCAVCPEISFGGKKFCFTGASTKYTRKQFSGLVIRLGGEILNCVSAKLDYLIIGSAGNPCWAYACYGRKVEESVALRKTGAKILLVHENDFHDAVADRIGQ